MTQVKQPGGDGLGESGGSADVDARPVSRRVVVLAASDSRVRRPTVPGQSSGAWRV